MLYPVILMTFEIVKRRIVAGTPQIQIYRRGTIYFNIAAYNLMRGWTRVLLVFDRETKILRLIRDVSLKKEKTKYTRKITHVGQTISVSAGKLVLDYGVIEQHDIVCSDHGPNFLEFGPLLVKGDEGEQG